MLSLDLGLKQTVDVPGELTIVLNQMQTDKSRAPAAPSLITGKGF